MNLKNFEIPKTLRQKFFVICLLAMTVYNCFALYQENKKIAAMKKLIPHQIIGHKLVGLENYTKRVSVMGYFTDAPEEDEASAKLFSYAQFLVAPTILDYNNVNHEYILFVCNNPEITKIIMTKIGAEPFKENEFGMVLARRPL